MARQFNADQRAKEVASDRMEVTLAGRLWSAKPITLDRQAAIARLLPDINAEEWTQRNEIEGQIASIRGQLIEVLELKEPLGPEDEVGKLTKKPLEDACEKAGLVFTPPDVDESRGLSQHEVDEITKGALDDGLVLADASTDDKKQALRRDRTIGRAPRWSEIAKLPMKVSGELLREIATDADDDPGNGNG
jgi:hypothetical protein